MNFKSLIYLLIFTISSSLNAQESGFFDPQPENFMKQLKVIFKENSRSELDEVYNNLEKEYKEGKMTSGQMAKMVDVLNKMHELKMRPYPHYSGLITAVSSAASSGYSEEFLDRWYVFLKGIIKKATVGKTKDFKKFVDFSNDLFMYNALVADRSKMYTIDTKDLSFEFKDNDFLVVVPSTTLKGFFHSDTAKIYETSGSYNIMTNTWVGKSGKIQWNSIENGPQAEFGKYEIDLSKPQFTIDSCKLFYSEYFPNYIYGSLTNKINRNKSDDNFDYPRFSSYAKDYKYPNILAPNVKASGGFSIMGDKVVLDSKEGNPVNVEIYNKDNTKKLFEGQGANCYFIKGEFIRMKECRALLYVQDDTISHSFCDFDYKIPQNEVVIVKDQQGAGRAKFKSTLLKMSFDTEMITWDLDSNFMDLQVLQGKGKQASQFISHNNFDVETYNQVRTAAGNVNPLFLMSKYNDKFPDGIPLSELVSAFGPNFSNASVLPMVFLLEQNGFARYDQVHKTIHPDIEYVDFYLKANKKEKDFDLLRFSGYGERYVGRLFTDNKKLEVNNVHKIPFNDSSEVYFFPYKGTKVDITGNRRLKMDGKLMLARLDVFGKDYIFDYDSFMLSSDFIERVDIYVPEREVEVKKDEKLRPLMSSIENMKADMFLNARFNKSGSVTAINYPKIKSKDKSFVNYDHPNIYNGIYSRDKFYFELEPFMKDSLGTFFKDDLFFKGTLYSHDIFEPIPESLRIQPDWSLGFVNTTPTSGLKTYRDNGEFIGEVKLSNQGLLGTGTLFHITASMQSDSILFFPQSTSLMANKFSMEKLETGVQFPKIESDSSFVEWHPYTDTMLIANKSNKPFNMYDNATKMSGILLLEKSGLTGRGYLDFDEAKISSKLMKFSANEMNADTASMEIKGLGDEVNFKTPNVKARMDFKEKIGYFKSNEADIATTFAKNRFQADINEFKWEMEKKFLTFKAKEGTKGAKFISTDPIKDSLVFYPKEAEYDMPNSIIKMSGIEEFEIADSKVIPEEGRVTILPEGKIQTLNNAKIEGDTANYYHVFNNVTLDVYGKNDVIGRGEYTLLVDDKEFPIKINEIKTTKVIINPNAKEKKQIAGTTIEGIGKVDKVEQLKIYRNVDFHGNVHIFFNKKYPHFEGEQRIKFVNPRNFTPWFNVNNEINVDQLSLYKEDIESIAGEPLLTGINIDRENRDGFAGGIYTTIMDKKKYIDDQIGFDARGLISHTKGTNVYTFGDTFAINHPGKKGNVMKYDDSAGTVNFAGTFNPNLKIGGIPLVMAGYMDNDIRENTYEFHGGIGMNIKMDNNVLNIIANFVNQEFGIDKGIKYTQKENERAVNELFNSKDLAKIEKEIEASGAIQSPPKSSSYNFFFPNLFMEYNKEDKTFRSKPEVGIGLVSGVPVNKIAKGYIEIGYGEYFDYFNFYIMSKSKEWLFMTYSDGVFGVLSSNDMVNSSIKMIEPRKRLVKKSSSEFYRYAVADDYEASTFVKRMKKGGEFNTEESKPVQNEESENLNLSEKELKNAEEFETKSQEDLKEEAEKLDLKDKEKAELEKLLKELEAEEQKLKELKQKASEEAEDQKIEPTKSDIKAPEEVLDSGDEAPEETEEVKEVDNTERKEKDASEEKDEKPAPKKKKTSNSLFDAYF